MCVFWGSSLKIATTAGPGARGRAPPGGSERRALGEEGEKSLISFGSNFSKLSRCAYVSIAILPLIFQTSEKQSRGGKKNGPERRHS